MYITQYRNAEYIKREMVGLSPTMGLSLQFLARLFREIDHGG